MISSDLAVLYVSYSTEYSSTCNIIFKLQARSGVRYLLLEDGGDLLLEHHPTQAQPPSMRALCSDVLRVVLAWTWRVHGQPFAVKPHQWCGLLTCHTPSVDGGTRVAVFPSTAPLGSCARCVCVVSVAVLRCVCVPHLTAHHDDPIKLPAAGRPFIMRQSLWSVRAPAGGATTG